MRVLVITLLLLVSTFGMKKILTASCDSTISLFQDNSFLSSSVKLPAFTDAVLGFMDSELDGMFKKACPAATAAQLAQMKFHFGDAAGTLLGLVDLSADTTFKALKEAGCLQSGLKIFHSFAYLNLPQTCNKYTWDNTGTCKFKIDFETVAPGLSFVANIAKCPDRKVPQFAIECEGERCEDVLKPCSADSDCSGTCEQLIPETADRLSETDVTKFFIDLMTAPHFLKKSEADAYWARSFANKVIARFVKLMQFAPLAAGKEFFGAGKLNIGVCGIAFSKLDQIGDQCTKISNGKGGSDCRSDMCRTYVNGTYLPGYRENRYSYKCLQWKDKEKCPAPTEESPGVWKCDFIKPYSKSLAMTTAPLPSVSVETGFADLGFASDCDSAMTVWMGKDRVFSGQIGVLNKGFAEVVAIVSEELASKRKVSADDMKKSFVPSAIEFWKNMMTAAPTGAAPAGFDGYSMVQLMFDEMMVRKCEYSEDSYFVKKVMRVKDETASYYCYYEPSRLRDSSFVKRCGSLFVSLNGSPIAKTCGLPTFTASQTQQDKFKGIKGLPSSCSMAGGDECSFQIDLTPLMRGKKATARMWMKTCPSGLPAMYMDVIGAGTAPLQNPVGEFCDPDADTPTTTCSDPAYMCANVGKEFPEFLQPMAYDNDRLYVPCQTNGDCTPWNYNQEVNSHYNSDRYPSVCKEGVCQWDSNDYYLNNYYPERKYVHQRTVEQSNGNKPVSDDSIFGLLQTVVGMPRKAPTDAKKRGVCIGVEMDFEGFADKLYKWDSETLTMGDLVSSWSPAKDPAQGTGSPTKVGGTGSPTSVRGPTEAKASNSGSAVRPACGVFGLAAAAIALAF